VIDPDSGLFIPQPRMPLGSNLGSSRPKPKGWGTVTYRCWTCGESIVKPWEVMFIDDAPGREHASDIAPGKVTPSTTTHHDWHMQSQQRED
jgi:hypothetical protein